MTEPQVSADPWSGSDATSSVRGGASGLLVDIYLWTAWKVRARAVLPLLWRGCRSEGRLGVRRVACRARMNLAGCPEPILSRVRSECGDVCEVLVRSVTLRAFRSTLAPTCQPLQKPLLELRQSGTPAVELATCNKGCLCAD